MNDILPLTGSNSILFVGGGSIGHIAPSVAVAKILKQQFPSLICRFVCGTRPEDALFIEKNGFSATPLGAPRLSVGFPWKFWSAYGKARAMLIEEKPRVIFSKGGYVSVPVCLAAKKLGIPIILHESDAVSGWANWLVGRWAEKICLGFEGSLKNPKAVFIGNPVAASVTEGSRQKGVALTGLSRMRPILLVLGGSQGSLAINQAIAHGLFTLLGIVDVIHVTGEGKRTVEGKIEGYWQCPFAYEEYPHLFAAADIALSRAGAGTIAELAANGLPTILVPLKGAAHNHQEKNARLAAQSGGCVVIDQRELLEKITETVRTILEPPTYELMRKKMRTLHRSDATRQIADLLAGYLA
ncbi:MAG: UDP-N-acetylglucosamine--N-acetylmuramyl-(pentapeptide) pyrophosphoryl-undecaprenol N-acetylglucosamine transferase [Candidatus Peribacteraceae bacterium]|nr:UDP-N-acetylglucosamine--N-acetylmuramyl-(pentapeptide) pyrophosphoryl-undecaprenol N-acetylglucosamine transferase [Candidatus Peribacteraceae bacterium]MDD5074363.1 UDP-N-acetylglucosamine--N-acetylmuramyl-(pentapeptide) pyrophosphoryl-undecaprenol N-acetylglucosamine transferase [Candidatus Peribacteraceae bacterium]